MENYPGQNPCHKLLSDAVTLLFSHVTRYLMCFLLDAFVLNMNFGTEDVLYQATTAPGMLKFFKIHLINTSLSYIFVIYSYRIFAQCLVSVYHLCYSNYTQQHHFFIALWANQQS